MHLQMINSNTIAYVEVINRISHSCKRKANITGGIFFYESAKSNNITSMHYIHKMYNQSITDFW